MIRKLRGALIAVFTFIGIVCFSHRLLAQSEDVMLAEVIDIYNNATVVVDRVRSNPKKYEVMDSIRDISQTAMERLRILKLSNNAEIAKNARYFYMNFKYNFAFGYAALGKIEVARQYLSELVDDMNFFDETQFPLRYTKGGTNFIIKYDNFTPTRGEYYIAYAELLNKANDPAKSLTYIRKAVPLLSSNWLKYVCFFNAIDNKEKLNQYDTECIQFCSLHLNAYYNLQSSDIDTIAAYNLGTYRRATYALDKAIEKGIASQESFDYLQQAIQILKYYLDPYKEKDEAQRKKNKFILLRWYHEAVMSNYSNKDFVRNAMNFADAYADPANNDKLNWLKRFEQMDLNCADIQWLMEQYQRLDLSLESNRISPQLKTCQEKEAKAAQEAEAARKKQERKQSKGYSSSQRLPLFYVGMNVFPFLKVPRDFGLALNLGGANMVTEFSYLKVKGKPENYFDLSLQDVTDVDEHLWDGYFAHLNLKFPTQDWNNGRTRPYAGFLVAYNERTFQPFQTTVTNLNTGSVAYHNVQPTSKQYSGMVNFGFMAVKGLGLDFFMGFGASYNQFDGKLQERGDSNYEIADLMLKHRKDAYWNFIMRIGMSVGIGFAKE